MNQKTYQLTLNFDQILDLVKQLPESDKIQLSKELEKETLNHKLTQLLETFKTDELSLETITEEVEKVRAEIYGQQATD
ncbi:MAG: type II toxin-antitoxin system VapB15 family antitoxin [Microcystis aeruginosa]